MKTNLLVLFVVCSGLQAQTLSPELAPIAAKFRADVTALKTQEETTLARVRKGYEDALNGAEKLATVAKNNAALAAIREERQRIGAGADLPQKFPGGLPESLKAPRQVYLDGWAKVPAESVSRQQRAYGDYLRVLSALQAKAAPGSELAAQIVAEKDAALDGAPMSLPVGGNKVLNGNFAEKHRNGFPKGWTYRYPSPFGYTGPVLPAASFTAVAENNDTFLRGSFQGAVGFLEMTIKIPPEATKLTFKFHARGKMPEDINLGVGLDLQRLSPPYTWGDGIHVGKLSTAWRPFVRSRVIPEAAESAKISIGTSRPVEGVLEIQRVELEFETTGKREPPDN